MKKNMKNHNVSPETNAEQTAVNSSDHASTQELVDELNACQKELAELKDKFLRVSADLQNFKARVAKERAAWVHDTHVALFKDLLPIVDDFERALVERQKTRDDPQFNAWFEGFELVGKSINKFLSSTYGVQEIDCSGAFDPRVHDALVYVVAPHKKAGEIIAVLQKGYKLDNTIIRPAKVSVAQ
jgi:molecular chaperone GrpE